MEKSLTPDLHTRKVGSAGLSITVDDIFVAAQLGQAHGAAGMQLLGADAHFAPQAKLSAIGKAGGGVDIAALSTAAVNRSAWACVRVRMASLWPVECRAI